MSNTTQTNEFIADTKYGPMHGAVRGSMISLSTHVGENITVNSVDYSYASLNFRLTPDGEVTPVTVFLIREDGKKTTDSAELSARKYLRAFLSDMLADGKLDGEIAYAKVEQNRIRKIMLEGQIERARKDIEKLQAEITKAEADLKELGE